MSNIHSIGQSGFILTLIQTVLKGVPALVMIYLARLYGSDEFGEFIVLTGYVAAFMALTELGFEQDFVRKASRFPADRKERFNVLIRVVTAISTIQILLFMALFFAFLGDEYDRWMAIGVGIWWWLLRLNQSFLALQRVEFEEQLNLKIQSISVLFLVIYLSSCYLNQSPIHISVYGLAFSAGIPFSVWLYKYKTFFDSPLPSLERMYLCVKESSSFAIQNISWVGYYHAGTIVMSFYLAQELTGIYGAFFRLSFFLYILPEALVNAASPLLHMFNQQANSQTERVSNALISIVSTLGMIYAISIIFIGQDVAHILFGPDFTVTDLFVKLLAIAVLCRCLSLALLEFLTTNLKQSVRTRIMLINLLVLILFSIILIPEMGLEGAVLALVVAEVFQLIQLGFSTNRIEIKKLSENFRSKTELAMFFVLPVILITLIIFPFKIGPLLFVCYLSSMVAGVWFVLKVLPALKVTR